MDKDVRAGDAVATDHPVSRRIISPILAALSPFISGYAGFLIGDGNMLAPYLFAAAALLITITVITTDVVWDIVGRPKRVVRIPIAVAFCGLFTLVVFLAFNHIVINENERLAKTPIYNGSLFPGDDPLPEYLKLSLELNGVPTDHIVLLMGDNSYAHFSNINTSYTLSDGQKPFIEIGKRANGSITISTTVIDGNNNKVAKIINNEFAVDRDFSFNPLMPNFHTLIVRDSQGDEVLNSNFIQERVIRITGRFLVEGQAFPVIINRDAITYKGGGSLSRMIFRDTGLGVIFLTESVDLEE